MTRIVIATILLLSVVASASAGVPPIPKPPPQQAVVYAPVVRLCPGPARTVKTPPITQLGVITHFNAYVNGHELHGWITGPAQAEFGGYGVLVVITVTRKAGPAYIRLATARWTCANVKVVIRWKR